MALGRSLDEIVGGAVDPLDVIFKDQIVENVYRYGMSTQRCYPPLFQYVDALADKTPAMRILEIGAGTGGATRSIISTLTQHGRRRYQEYSFTDVSPSFFERAKQLFEHEVEDGHMAFHVLNVENDPRSQGFELGHYDVVVAANVLHATMNIDISLANAKALLGPGGKLILFEITNVELLLSHFCFGVLPGWWLSEDQDRVWGPLLSTEGWQTHLLRCGYSGLDTVFRDFDDSKHQMSSVMISTAPEADSTSTPIEMTYVIVDISSESQQAVANQVSHALSQRGSDCIVLSMAQVAKADFNGAACIFLAELDSSVLRLMTESALVCIKHKVSQCGSLVCITSIEHTSGAKPCSELVTGFARVIRSERPGLVFKTLAFERHESSLSIAEKCLQILRAEPNSENTFRVSNGIVQIPRLVPAEYLEEYIRSYTSVDGVVQNSTFGGNAARSLALQQDRFDTPTFEDDLQYDTPLIGDEVEFATMACGVTPFDLDSARDMDDGTPWAMGASGTVSRVGPDSEFHVGDRVFGICLSGGVKTHSRSVDGFLAKLPEDVDWTVAATIPVAYTTAHAALHRIANVRKGDKILIQAAWSAIGQAATELAQLCGAVVYQAVDSEPGRKPLVLLATEYDVSASPGRQTARAQPVFDIVLCCDPRWMPPEILDHLAPFGRLVKVCSGNDRVDPQTALSLTDLGRKNIRFEAFDLRYRSIHDHVGTKRSFQDMVNQVQLTCTSLDLRTISLRTPVISYPPSRIKDAMREANSESQAKIVLEFRGEDAVSVLTKPQRLCRFQPGASYVIAGGLGGVGRSVARWMASQGASNLILLSRSGPVDEASKELLKHLEGVCKSVVTPVCDVADSTALRNSIAKCLESMPPIKGCIQCSMVLKVRKEWTQLSIQSAESDSTDSIHIQDNSFESMTVDEWNDAIRPKVNWSSNLADLFGSELDFLILL